MNTSLHVIMQSIYRYIAVDIQLLNQRLSIMSQCTILLPVAGLRGGLRGHRPTLLLYLCWSQAKITCLLAPMQEFLTQFRGAYVILKA